MAAEVVTAERTSEDAHVDELIGGPIPETVSAESMEAAEDAVAEEPAAEPEPAKPDPGKDLEAKYKNLEYIYGKQTKELGELRSMVAKLAETKKDPEKKDERKFLDRFVEDPQVALEAELTKREQAKAAQAEAQAMAARQSVDRMYTAIPELDALTDTILALAKEDGIEAPTKAMLDFTVANDYPLALQYARRAQMKIAMEKDSGKGKKVLQQVAKGSRTQTAVTGNSGQSSSKTRLSSVDINNMSDAELETHLKQYRK